METIILKVAPVLAIFVLGIILRRTDVFTEKDADAFLKLVFYVSLPASILVSIPKIELTLELVYLPVIAAVIIVISFFVARAVGGAFKLPRGTLGVFLVGSMIINTASTFPFVIAVYGEEGFARAALYDFGNGLMALTFAYFIAVKHGNDHGYSGVLKKFATSTPLWALLIALVLNYTRTSVPPAVLNFLNPLGSTLIPLFMISLGIRFNTKVVDYKPLVSVIFIRMFLGLIMGFTFVKLFGLEGLNRSVVLISSAAPVGLTTLTFATMENLDTQFASSLVSISILFGIILTPVLVIFLN